MMQEIHRLPVKKTWALARNTKTGQIYCGEYGNIYCGPPSKQQDTIDRAKDLLNTTGEHTSIHRRYYRSVWNAGDECLSDVELFGYIPVYRGQLKFNKLYHGTSGVSIMFTTLAGHGMTLKTAYADKFFELVGEGRIKMDAGGFYEFDFSFIKGGDKVYIELYGYE